MNIFQWTGGIAGGMILQTLGFINPVLQEQGRQIFNESLPISLPDMPEIITGLRKNPYWSDFLKESAKKHGFSERWIEIMFNNSRQILSVQDAFLAMRRGLISEDNFSLYAKMQGFSEDDIKILPKLLEFFPSPIDLVTFAVREIYSPEVVSAFGLDEDFPADFEKEGFKAGLSSEQAHNYWKAHWQLPSATQGYEMFHRDIISHDELLMLLKSLDYMPFWREKLEKISYNPLTRVDVRRMYAVGVLDEKDVEDNFRYAGYSPENAKLLKDFTIKYDNPEIDGLTRASVVSAYKKSLITREELASYFKMLNYTDSVLEFWLNSADYEKTLDRIESYTVDISQRFQMGVISISEARQELLNLNVPTLYVEDVLEKEIRQKAKRTKTPSLEDLRRWLTTQLIDEVSFVQKMRALGYQEVDIERYLSEISSTQDTSKLKYLSLETYIRWLKSNVISASRFAEILSSQGVSEEKQNEYLQKAGVI